MVKPKYLFIFALLLCSIATADDLYNLTSLDNANNIYEYIYNMNLITDYYIGYAILIMSFGIVFFITYSGTANFLNALSAGSFFTLLSGSMLLPLGIIDWTSYMFAFIVLVFSVLISVWFGARSGG